MENLSKTMFLCSKPCQLEKEIEFISVVEKLNSKLDF